MLSATNKLFYVECRAEWNYAECHYAECHYAECRGFIQKTFFDKLTITLIVEVSYMQQASLKGTSI
jgi:hypothetical protein